MNKDEIRQKIKTTPLKQEEIYIDEWGCKVIVKELTAKSYLEISELGNSQAKTVPYLIINSVYTEEGERLFTQKDVELLLELPPSVFTKLILSINRLNGFESPKN